MQSKNESFWFHSRARRRRRRFQNEVEKERKDSKLAFACVEQEIRQMSKFFLRHAPKASPNVAERQKNVENKSLVGVFLLIFAEAFYERAIKKGSQ